MKRHCLNLYISALICGLSIFMMSSSVYADSVENIRVIKISPQDERAVIKTSGRKLRIIKVGDVITVKEVLSSEFKVQSTEEKNIADSGMHVPGAGFKKQVKRSELRVVEIAAGRVVFEEMTDEGFETVIIRLENGKQRVERIRKVVEEQPLLSAPIQEGAQKENKFKKSGFSH